MPLCATPKCVVVLDFFSLPIFNTGRMTEEAKGAIIISALLGGGQALTIKGLSSDANRQTSQRASKYNNAQQYARFQLEALGITKDADRLSATIARYATGETLTTADKRLIERNSYIKSIAEQVTQVRKGCCKTDS